MSQKEHRRRVRFRADDTYTRAGSWRTQAACNWQTGVAESKGLAPHKIPDGFCSESLAEQRDAAQFCHQYCDKQIREACLEFAKQTGEEAYVWGGTTETERRHLMERDRRRRVEEAQWPVRNDPPGIAESIVNVVL